MGFSWTDKQNEIDEIIAEDINAIAHEAIRLEKDKAESDLSNVSDEDFKIKAEGAGVVGAVSSVNGKTGDVELTASDVGAYTTDEADSAISGAVDTNIGILRAEILQELSEELPKKADKTTLFTWGTSGIENFVLENNQEAMFFADMAVMVLAMPETINDIYHSNFSFSSGEEPTTLTYSATPIIWVGDDCDADGIFVPEANTRYEVSVKKLGDDIVARVGAY